MTPECKYLGCEEPAYSDSPCCILHLDFPTKATPLAEFETIEELKRNRTEEMLESGKLLFGRTKIYGVDARGRNCSKLDFTLATIRGNAWFDNATVEGDAQFSKARIEGQASFRDTIINGWAKFDDVVIEGKSRSVYNYIVVPSSFDKAQIKGSANFKRATIHGGAYFDRVEIGSEEAMAGFALFDRAIIRGDASFKGAKMSDADFRRVTIDGDAEFNGAIIGGTGSFEGLKVKGNAKFDDVIIARRASFDEAIIEGDASFERAQLGDALFNGATIGGVAWFNGVIIEGNASFKGMMIKGDTFFDQPTFKGPGSFDGAIVSGLLSFTRAQFYRLTAQETAYKAAKLNYERRGEKVGADHYFNLQMEAARKQKNQPQRALEKLLIGKAMRYGTSWSRLFATWLIVALACGMLLGFATGQLESAVFGFVAAFVPGYAISHAQPGISTWVAGFETVVAAFLWAMFIAVFSRKFMR
jgi:uncharacterized protein YjbI with pentapeptide repeats